MKSMSARRFRKFGELVWLRELKWGSPNAEEKIPVNLPPGPKLIKNFQHVAKSMPTAKILENGQLVGDTGQHLDRAQG